MVYYWPVVPVKMQPTASLARSAGVEPTSSRSQRDILSDRLTACMVSLVLAASLYRSQDSHSVLVYLGKQLPSPRQSR